MQPVLNVSISKLTAASVQAFCHGKKMENGKRAGVSTLLMQLILGDQPRLRPHEACASKGVSQTNCPKLSIKSYFKHSSTTMVLKTLATT